LSKRFSCLRDGKKEIAMFVRIKNSGAYQYLQVVHNERIEGRV
jgi:hypothetical protein